MVPSPSPVARAEKFFVRVNQVLVRLWARLHASLTGWCQSRPACGRMRSEACCFVLSESLCAVDVTRSLSRSRSLGCGGAGKGVADGCAWVLRSRAREGHSVDALAPGGDEGRGTLRKAMGSREQALIHGCPNGATPPAMEIGA
jgi:hypothetical protein